MGDLRDFITYLYNVTNPNDTDSVQHFIATAKEYRCRHLLMSSLMYKEDEFKERLISLGYSVVPTFKSKNRFHPYEVMLAGQVKASFGRDSIDVIAPIHGFYLDEHMRLIDRTGTLRIERVNFGFNGDFDGDSLNFQFN